MRRGADRPHVRPPPSIGPGVILLGQVAARLPAINVACNRCDWREKIRTSRAASRCCSTQNSEQIRDQIGSRTGGGDRRLDGGNGQLRRRRSGLLQCQPGQLRQVNAAHVMDPPPSCAGNQRR